MFKPEETRAEALKRLDDDIKAFEAKRARPILAKGDTALASDALRLMAGLISGLLGGLGLGWFVDHLMHTQPFGLVIGLVIGAAGSIFAAVRRAGQVTELDAKPEGSSTQHADGDE